MCLCFGSKKVIQKDLTLKNVSSMPAKFQFHIDMANSVLSFRPTFGIVPGNHEILIRICYKPKNVGGYFKRVYCLFEHQVCKHLFNYGILYLPFPNMKNFRFLSNLIYYAFG